MYRYRFVAKLVFVGILIVLFLSGCGLWSRIFSSKEEEKTPAQLVSEGMDSLERGHYEDATQAFQKIKDRYPYSKFAVEAELKMADALYKRELYDEALDAYSEFEKLHPKNDNIPYVIYQKGMCHFKQVSTVDRDQSHSFKAREEFERLVKKFPRSEQASRARRKARECYISLAKYELYVGHHYYKMKKYRAAMGRYRYLLENYPDLGQYQEALEYLNKCKEKVAEKEGKS
jgi:outer membrane protein assembly factor BamD